MTNLSLICISAMEYEYPARVPYSEHKHLDDFKGTLTTLLQSLLFSLDCDPNIPVGVYTFYDGSWFAKYRVVLRLPRQLGYETVMPAGEARTETAAYRMAVIKAISTIRKDKAPELLGTDYTYVPHDLMDQEPRVDFQTFVSTQPEKAAIQLERYRKLLRAFFTTHQVMSQEIQEMVDEFTDPTRVIARRRLNDREAAREKVNPPKPIYTAHLGQEREPNFIHTPTHYSHSHSSHVYVRPSRTPGRDPWEASESDSPIENSTGWRWGTGSGYQADQELEDAESSVHPDQFYTMYHGGDAHMAEAEGVGGESSVQHTGGEFRSPFDMDTSEPVGEESVEDYNMEEVYDTLGDQFAMTDFSLGSTSDSDYKPTGRPFVPTAVRRTSRATGWTPGMYRE